MNTILNWLGKHKISTHTIAVLFSGLFLYYRSNPAFHTAVSGWLSRRPGWVITLLGAAGWLYSWYRNGQKQSGPADVFSIGSGVKCLAAAILILACASPANAQQKPKHAMVRILSAAASPVTHPKRTLKQTLGSVLFAIETGVDGARLGLEAADKVFDALSIQGKVPVLDEIYAVVSVGAKDAGKADRWLEKQEQSLFGTHN